MLLEAGATTEWVNADGHGLLTLAVAGGSVEVLNCLLGAPAVVASAVKSGDAVSALHAACEAVDVETACRLIEAGVPADAPNDDGGGF